MKHKKMSPSGGILEDQIYLGRSTGILSLGVSTYEKLKGTHR